MRRIILLTLGGLAFLIPSFPAAAQDVTVGPGGISVQPHRHYYDSDEWRARERQREYGRERHAQREMWRQRFYERHGYWPED